MPVRRPPLALLAVLACVLAGAAAPAAELAGHWAGAIELPGQKLEIDVDLAARAGVWTGDITIPAQGAKDLPLAGIVVDGAAVTFAIANIPGDPVFRGELAEDGATLAGMFTQGGQSFPFSLTSGESPVARARAALAGFDVEVERALTELKVPGLAVAILAAGEPVLLKGYGLRDVERKLPVTPQTLFAIGSTTKALTAFVLGALVDEGKLDWDEPVRSYIPDFRLHDRDAELRITPRDLVTHRCGLPRHDLVWYNNADLTRQELVSRLAWLEPNKDLRETWQYNNLAFLTAGYLGEMITGQSWEDNVRARIFEPLGMNGANFSVHDSQQAPDFALGYEEKDGVVSRMPFRPITNMGPAGSVNAGAEDMARWIAAQLGAGGAAIQAATLAELHTPQMVLAVPPDPEKPELPTASYAMGWFVQPYRGHHRLQHGGNIDGFTAFVSFLPQDDLGFVLLANKNETALPQLLERVAIDRLLGLEGRDWIGEALAKKAKSDAAATEAEKKADVARVKGTKPSHPLADYVGAYAHPGYGTVAVELRGKELSLTVNHITNPLEHWHYDVFNCAEGADDPALEDTKVQFLMDMKGNISGLRAPVEPMVEDVVFARRPDARLTDPVFLATLTGEYQLVNVRLRIELKGSALVAVLPGQPTYELIPVRGTDFDFKGLSGFSVTFDLDEKGAVRELRVTQPNGVFTATPAQ